MYLMEYVCMRTNIKTHLSQAGFSLVELIVASGISTIVALGSGAVMLQAVKTEQQGQAVANAARAGDILKRSVFANSQGGATDCSNSLEIDGNGNFDATAFTTTGLDLRLQNIPAFGADEVSRGSNTAFGEIVDFKIVGADANPEFTDFQGNDVYEGAVYLYIRKGLNQPITPVYLGTLGLRVDAANALQGCVATGESDDNNGSCDSTEMFSGVTTGPFGNCRAGPGGEGGPPNDDPDSIRNNYGGCEPGEIRVWIERPGHDGGGGTIEPGPENPNSAVGICRDITPDMFCGCLDSPDGTCTDVVARVQALRSYGNGGAFDCRSLPDVRRTTIVRTMGTPTPTFPIPTPEPDQAPPPPLTPQPALPTATPTATPTQAPPAPAPGQTCGAANAEADCTELCLNEYWSPFIGNCITYCNNAIACPTPGRVAPTPMITAIPSPPPMVDPPIPIPVNGACNCGGVIIPEGSYCGGCYQEFEFERQAYDRGYIYRDRTHSLRCISGSLQPAGANPYGGLCGSYGGGTGTVRGMHYEYW